MKVAALQFTPTDRTEGNLQSIREGRAPRRR